MSVALAVYNFCQVLEQRRFTKAQVATCINKWHACPGSYTKLSNISMNSAVSIVHYIAIDIDIAIAIDIDSYRYI